MNVHSNNNPFLTKNVVKNGYYGNEAFGLTWDYTEVRQIAAFVTTKNLEQNLTGFRANQFYFEYKQKLEKNHAKKIN